MSGQIKNNPPAIAIVGITSMLGGELLTLLGENGPTYSELRVFGDEDHAGEVYAVGSNEVVVTNIKDVSFDKIDVAIFVGGPAESEKLAPIAVEAGAIVIDTSISFRLSPEVPLVVSGVNSDIIKDEAKIIACPGAITAQILPVLNVLQREAGLKRTVVSTYQSVSGAGREATDELWSQVRAVFTQQEIQSELFPHQIAFNCIPQVGLMTESGITSEEHFIIAESQKILADDKLKMSVSAVRVPVFHSDAVSLNVELNKGITPETLIKLLEAEEGIRVYPAADDFPMHLSSAETDEVHVGRIRVDKSAKHALNLWLVSDNLRKGAAVNVLQILEQLLG